MIQIHQIRYFAYGSNLNLRHLLEWCQLDTVLLDSELNPRPAILPDFRVRTNYVSAKGSGAANIERSSGATVEGVILTIPIPMLRLIRRKEGFPYRYREILVRVEDPANGKRMTAHTYQVTPNHCCIDDVPVSSCYRGKILIGAESHKLSMGYQRHLRRVLAVPSRQPAKGIVSGGSTIKGEVA